MAAIFFETGRAPGVVSIYKEFNLDAINHNDYSSLLFILGALKKIVDIVFGVP
jgi:hypothetical protein